MTYREFDKQFEEIWNDSIRVVLDYLTGKLTEKARNRQLQRLELKAKRAIIDFKKL